MARAPPVGAQTHPRQSQLALGALSLRGCFGNNNFVLPLCVRLLKIAITADSFQQDRHAVGFQPRMEIFCSHPPRIKTLDLSCHARPRGVMFWKPLRARARD